MEKKQLTLQEKLDPDMRLRLYKECLRKLKTGNCHYGGICTLLRGAMINNMFDQLELVTATMRDRIEKYFPELCKEIPLEVVRNDYYWWAPGNYKLRMKHLQDVISIMEKDKSISL